jgi:fluoride exporter
LVGALTWIGVALCGALGAFARFRVDGAVSARVPSDFPLGTLVVNLSGAFALGVLIGAAVPERAAMLAGTGFMGGYTTFSTWMVESERLGEGGNVGSLLANLWLSMLLGLGVAALGWSAGRAIA